MKNRWKLTAIIFICLFVVENLFVAWGYYSLIQDTNQEKECLFEICEDYPQAELDFNTDICYCYEYSVLDELIVAKEEWMR